MTQTYQNEAREALNQFEKKKFNEWEKQSKLRRPESTSLEQPPKNPPSVDARRDDQKAFEQYLTAVQDIKADQINIVDTRSDYSNEKMPSYYSNNKESVSKFNKTVSYEFRYTPSFTSSIINNIGKNGNYIILQTVSPWHDDSLQPFQLAYSTSETPHIYIRTGVIRQDSWNNWTEITDKVSRSEANKVFREIVKQENLLSANKVEATAKQGLAGSQPQVVVSPKEDGKISLDFTIPQGLRGERGPAGEGGAGITPIEIPMTNRNQNQTSTLAQGGYSVNLFDYRKLSQQKHFGVSEYIRKDQHGENIEHGIKFYNYGKAVLPSRSKFEQYPYLYAGPFSGIKKDKTLHLHHKWHETSKLPQSGQFEMIISRASDGVKQEVDIAYDLLGSSGKQDVSVDTYGYYYLNMGAVQVNLSEGQKTIPDHYEVDVKAFYSDRPSNPAPKRTDTQFEFVKHNGYELRSNGKDLKDEYKSGTMFDVLIRKVGVLNLKDAKTHRYNKDQDENESLLLIAVPDDCELPERMGPQSKIVGAKILTNNLCEIDPDGQASTEGEKQPYFLQDLVQEEVIIGGKRVEKWFFQIALRKDHAYKWRDLLLNTQIIYPLKAPKTINLQEGGYRVVLTDGRVINSCNYSQVDAIGDNTYEFKASGTGYGPIRIQRSQIAYIEGNIG